MPITTEIDWLTFVEPDDFAQFCQGRVLAKRFHTLNVRWGSRLRHRMRSIGRRIYDAYAKWVASGGTGECCFPESEFEGMVRSWGMVQDAESFASLLRHRDWLRAAVSAGYAASEDFPLPGETSSDPAHSHKKKSKKAKVERGLLRRREAAERREREYAAHRERTLWQFANEFRDVAGNPFRPVVFDPAWRTETVVGLAAGIDADGAYERLPILADALEEAGCTDPQVLSHAREPGTHVRGCWLIDMILERW